MRITHDVRPQGHYVTIHHDNITMSLRTMNGTPGELAEHAVEMRRKAVRLTRRADIIKAAIHGTGPAAIADAPDMARPAPQRLISAANYVVSCFRTQISESAIIELQEAARAAREVKP